MCQRILRYNSLSFRHSLLFPVFIGGVADSNVAFVVDYAGVVAIDDRETSVVNDVVADTTVANIVNHRCTLLFYCVPFLWSFDLLP